MPRDTRARARSCLPALTDHTSPAPHTLHHSARAAASAAHAQAPAARISTCKDVATALGLAGALAGNTVVGTVHEWQRRHSLENWTNPQTLSHFNSLPPRRARARARRQAPNAHTTLPS